MRLSTARPWRGSSARRRRQPLLHSGRVRIRKRRRQPCGSSVPGTIGWTTTHGAGGTASCGPADEACGGSACGLAVYMCRAHRLWPHALPGRVKSVNDHTRVRSMQQGGCDGHETAPMVCALWVRISPGWQGSSTCACCRRRSQLLPTHSWQLPGEDLEHGFGCTHGHQADPRHQRTAVALASHAQFVRSVPNNMQQVGMHLLLLLHWACQPYFPTC